MQDQVIQESKMMKVVIRNWQLCRYPSCQSVFLPRCSDNLELSTSWSDW